MMTYEAPVQDEAELEAMAEAELSRLRRQYRIMENDRMAYAEEARNQLRSQANVIDKLEHEKAELVLAIKAAKSPSNVRKDEAMGAELRALLDKRAGLVEQIGRERQQVAEIEEQIIKLSNEVHVLRQKIRSDHQLMEATNRNERQIVILENRLEVATRRFNALVCGNAKLRDEIDGLLKEREQFNIIWTRLSGQISTGKQIINDLIEQATIAYNQRDDELNKINALKERGQRDLKIHTSEMCEMQRTIDNEIKLQDFLGVKGQYREMNDLNAKKLAEQQAKRQELRDKIDAYNQILALVKQFTGEEEIEKLTAQFLKQEEENFALFNYVNELNDELEGLRGRVAELRVAIDEARALNVHRGQQQAETLETIAKELKQQTNIADASENRLIECNEVLENLLEGIEALFETIRCSRTPVLQLLGDNSKVTMNNVMLYLGIIEKRVNEMLNKMHWADRTQKAELRVDEERKPKLQVPALSGIAPTEPCPLCVEKEEMQNVSDGLEVPLAFDEVKTKLLGRLQHDHAQLLHNVSGCHLPASRKIIQKRYQ